MSSKQFDKLDRSDQMLRRAFPPTPSSPAVQVTIEKISGFELFNTRAYHNYETWSDGYRVHGYGVSVVAEDLDDAVARFVAAVRERESSVREPAP